MASTEPHDLRIAMEEHAGTGTYIGIPIGDYSSDTSTTG